MSKLISTFFKIFGLTISRISSKKDKGLVLTHELETRLKILNHFGISKLYDVGANTGQFASTMRGLGYTEEIVSFEPLSSAYEQLLKNAATDKKWTCENFALGDEEIIAEINISGNSYSSSMLSMRQEHIDYDPNSSYIGTEKIQIKTLDSVFTNYSNTDDKVWLKIDTQGFEKQVIEGALNSLSKITILQLEISLTSLYEEEPLFDELYPYIIEKGFELYTIENGIRDLKNGRLLQIDCLFKNINS